MSDDSSRLPPCLEEPRAENGQAARGAAHVWQQRAWESLWGRLSLTVGVMVVATVAIFMLPKIAGRSAVLKTRAEVRTDLWRQELVASGRVTRDADAETHRTRDLAIIAGLVATAGVAIAAAAYVALRPRGTSSHEAGSQLHGDEWRDHGAS